MPNVKELTSAFERIFNCHVCFHDYEGRIIAAAGPVPLHHMNPLCERLRKSKGVFAYCCEMEAELSERRLQERRAAIFKCCHAGLYEIAVPLFRDGIITGAMFVGPFKSLAAEVAPGQFIRQRRRTRLDAKERALFEKLPEVSPEQAKGIATFAELLAQGIERHVKLSDELSGPDASRRRKIESYLDCKFRHGASLGGLAASLGVGKVRACQIVKEEFKASFSKLLLARRLEHARHLLKESLMKMEAVASESGFKDLSYFHRAFKLVCGRTPKAYRGNLQRKGKTPVPADLLA